MENAMNHTCEICMNANIRLNAMDFIMWRAEMGWEQWKGQDMETAARIEDPS